MPCRLNADVHEGSNEVPTVPRRYRVNPHHTEQCMYAQWEEKSLRRFTTQYVIANSDVIQRVVRSSEPCSPGQGNAIM